MKKTLVALAALTVVGAASAQSTVTLYGRIDGSVGRTEVTAGGALAARANDVGMNVSSGVMSGSRWGMKGTEDLGGGLKANFVLESGIGHDTGVNGQGGLAFGRTAEVGLSGGFGSITLGRSYGLNVQVANSGWNVGAYGNYNAWSGTAVAAAGAWGNVSSNYTDPVRYNNAVTYMSPSMGGFTVLGQWSPGENGTPALSAGKNVQLGLNYGAGPLGVGFVYEAIDNVAPAADVKQWNIGFNYDFGVAKLGLSVERSKVDAGSKDSGWGLNVGVPLGAMSLAVEYAKETSKSAAGAKLSDAKAWDIRLTYPLSKRTYVYGRLQNGKANVAPDSMKLNAWSAGLVHSF